MKKHLEDFVMPFGQCNTPGTFQGYTDDSLREYLDLLCTASLDGLLM